MLRVLMLRRNSAIVNLARPIYRALRTAYLRTRHARGGFVETTGVPVFCDFADSSYVWYDAESDYLRFHKSVLEALVRISRGDVFVDVGAHFGFYAAFLAAVARRLHRPALIIAVEPDRHHFECLRKTAARAEGDGVHLHLVPAAVSDTDGVVSLYRTTASCLHSYADVGVTATSCYQVPAMTLDSLLAAHTSGERVALIKVDVDGAEPFVIDGWHATIQRHAPIVLTEFSPATVRGAGRDPRTLFEQLCGNFAVAHVDHLQHRVYHVSGDDYAAIAARVGDGVTDLVLSAEPLPLVGFPGGNGG
jgi:FkbM family methyltransferase